ncbi:MAG: glycosyltransferase family 9 protein [Bacteroidota bacterium]|nr:glycosyltransferase family 9 protein [Bacteroidota bacterium]
MPEIKKILIIRLSSLGDIILSFPLLKKLKEKFPGSEIHFFTKKDYGELLLLNPLVDKLILFDDSLKMSRKQLGYENYDMILDLHKNFRSILVSIFNGKTIHRYKKEDFKKFLLVKFKINLFKEIIPVYKKYMQTIKEHLHSDDYNFVTSQLNFDKVRFILDDYIIISPSSKHFTKTYPADEFIKYINSNKEKKFVLIGDRSRNDEEICKYIELKCDSVLNLCGKLSLSKLANVIYYSRFVICNDSAVLHFAEALGKKVTAIFGSTIKEFGFFPQLTQSEVLEVNNLQCRPCTHFGRESCPEGHFKCMKEIELTVSS